MPIKQKDTSPAEREKTTAPNEKRAPLVNAELDTRLTAFMSQNQKSTDYYSQLVKENPERAVRSLMLTRMFRHEDQMKMVERQLPQVKEWVQKQPGLMDRIMAKIKTIAPMYQDKAFVGEAMRLKGRIDFKPPKTGVAV